MGKLFRSMLSIALLAGLKNAAYDAGTYPIPKKKKQKSKYTRNQPKRK